MSAGNESDIITIPNMLVLVRPRRFRLWCRGFGNPPPVFGFSPTSVFPGRGSDDGEPVPVHQTTGQLHHQIFQRGGVHHQAGGRADVGLRQQAGRLPQEVPAGPTAHIGEVWPLQRGNSRRLAISLLILSS